MLWLTDEIFSMKNRKVGINFRTNDNIWKVATGQGDDYATRYLLDYSYFKNYYKIITTVVSK